MSAVPATTADCVVGSPVGRLRLVERGGALAALEWTDDAPSTPATALLRRAAEQLAEYFAGRRRGFDLPLAPEGTAHQKRVWTAMCAIPHGATGTYGDLARAIGSSARAVGTACGKNPIPVIVPCHRIVAAGGGIGGYSGRGGLETKRVLLAIEGVHHEQAAGQGDLLEGLRAAR
jgi:methylated-DNA-[protein]-cysteine S-methyltransferase